MNTQQKTLFITGGASGIGYAMAEYFGAQGHMIIIADINLDAAEEAVSKLSELGYAAHPIKLDVGSLEDIAGLPQRMGDLRVDVLINNAGIQHVSRIEDFPPEKWQLLINIMLVGPAMLTQTFLPGMRERNFGRIINVGSIHSLVASPFKSAYIAAKHGLIGLAKTVALENGDKTLPLILCAQHTSKRHW